MARFASRWRVPEPERRQSRATADAELAKQCRDVGMRRREREIEIARDLLLETLGQQQADDTALHRRERRVRDEQAMMQHDATVETFERAERIREEIAIRGGESAALVADAIPAVVRLGILVERTDDEDRVMDAPRSVQGVVVGCREERG